MNKIKKFVVCSALCLCVSMSLSACSLQTMGDALGVNLTGYTYAFLGGVAWPNGTSAADFKAFVGGVMSDLNLDSALNSVDIEKGIEDALAALDVEISSENSEEIKETIIRVLKENGVDTDNIEIDVDGIIDSLSKDSDGSEGSEEGSSEGSEEGSFDGSEEGDVINEEETK